VWAVLAAASVGLLPSTLGRLYASAFYAMHDTRTPLRFALVRVSLGIALGYVLALQVPRALGLGPAWGAAGITLASGLAAVVEYFLLRGAVRGRVGAAGVGGGLLARLWAAAVIAAAAGWLARLALPPLHPIPEAAVVLAVFGAAYLGAAAALGAPQAGRLLKRAPR
jgi:putative peptidoglycan lipid II flippase